MTAFLTALQGNSDRVATAVAECRRMGIEVLPPDVNESSLDFTIVERSSEFRVQSSELDTPAQNSELRTQNQAIRFGLAAVKNVGRGAAQAIIEARAAKGAFSSLEDFCNKVEFREINRKVIEALIKCGAFDQYDDLGGRQAMLDELEKVMSAAQAAQRAAEVGQVTMFELMLAGGSGSDEQGNDGSAAALWSGRASRGEVVDGTPKRDKLAWEKEFLGLYVSDHPLMPLEPILSAIRSCNIAEIENEHAGRTITIGGIISAQRRIATRAGKMMLAATVEDLTGSMEVIVFPRLYDETGSQWEVEVPVVISGKVDFRDDVAQLLCETVQPLEAMLNRSVPYQVQIDVPRTGNDEADVQCLQQVINALHSYKGSDRFDLCLGGYQLAGHPGATTWWNRKLEALLHDLLGPNRVQVREVTADVVELDYEPALLAS